MTWAYLGNHRRLSLLARPPTFGKAIMRYRQIRINSIMGIQPIPTGIKKGRTRKDAPHIFLLSFIQRRYYSLT